MPLTTGSRVGPYQIVAPLGSGGMGEVYRARDTRLGRDVAIKILPKLFSRDPDRIARFEQEARTLASLNHPHIAQIHGIEETSGGGRGAKFQAARLVMEYVDGQTLATRLATGPLPLDEALPIATQIADGLSSAHEHGIIHRDVKPSNIAITDDGVVKILDFGLAKTVGPFDESAEDRTTFAAIQETHAGAVVGTVAYMSPEQARGRQVDRRTDVWAFGCLLYEMVSGRPAFAEATVTDTLAAIVSREPDWAALPPSTPDHVQWVIRQCLERDPKRRLRDIADAALALERAAGFPGAPEAAAVRADRRGVPSWAAAAAVIATALLVGLWKAPSDPAPPEQARDVLQFRIPVQYLRADAQHRPVIAPNGRAIAWCAGDSLWLHDLERATTRAIIKDVQPTYLAWSPNSDEISFVSGKQLFKVSATGGGLQPIAEIPERLGRDTPGFAWLSNDQFVFASAMTNSGIEVVAPLSGSSFKTLLAPPDGVRDFHSPSRLPDGGILAVVDRLDEGPDRIAAIRNGQTREVFKAAGERLEAPVYSPSGHLIFERQRGNRGLWFVPFAIDNLSTSGAPTLISSKAAWPSVSANGTLVYTEGDSGSAFEAVVFDPASPLPRGIGRPLLSMSQPRLSPDGKRIVVVGLDDQGTRDLYTIDVQSGSVTRITQAEDAVSPFWAPGNRVLFVNHGGRSPEGDIRMVHANGSRMATKLVEKAYDPTLSPDGRWLIFNRPSGRANGSDVYRIRIDPETLKPAAGADEAVLLSEKFNERVARVHRSGSFIAFEAEKNGPRDLFLTTYPQAGERWQISTNGVDYWMWHPTEDRLIYVQQGRIFEVPVTLTPKVVVGQPRQMFDERGTRLVLDNMADITADGRFVAVQRPSTSEAPLGVIVVVRNWFNLFRGPGSR